MVKNWLTNFLKFSFPKDINFEILLKISFFKKNRLRVKSKVFKTTNDEKPVKIFFKFSRLGGTKFDFLFETIKNI